MPQEHQIAPIHQPPIRSLAHANQSRGVTLPAVPVVQRALKTKNEVFIDQVMFQTARGIASLSGRIVKVEKNEVFVQALQTAGLLDLSGLVKTYKKGKATLDSIFRQEKKIGEGFSGINEGTLKTHELLLPAIELLNESAQDWGAYKTEIDTEDTSTPGIAKGMAGELKTQPGKIVSTHINWQEVDTKSGEGQKMTAVILGPDHPLGTAPSGKVLVKAQGLSGYTNQSYIAGHLLNNNLGGPGNDPRNITAIPADVNGEQSDKTEEEVKNRVNNRHELVFYQVAVTYAEDPTSKFHYAKQLKTIYGSYKKDTDFKTVNLAATTPPTPELKDLHTHTISIKKPAKYLAGKGGYKAPPKTIQDFGPFELSKLTVDPADSVILKDPKQIKLEFVSFAVNSIPMDRLKEEIKKLQKEFEAVSLKNTALEESSAAVKEKLIREKESSAEVKKENTEIKQHAVELDKAVDKLKSEVLLNQEEIKKKEEEIKKNQAFIDRLSTILEDIPLEDEQDTKGNDEIWAKFGRISKVLGASKKEIKELKKQLDQVTLEKEEIQGKFRESLTLVGELYAQLGVPKDEAVKRVRKMRASLLSMERFDAGYDSIYPAHLPEQTVADKFLSEEDREDRADARALEIKGTSTYKDVHNPGKPSFLKGYRLGYMEGYGEAVKAVIPDSKPPEDKKKEIK